MMTSEMKQRYNEFWACVNDSAIMYLTARVNATDTEEGAAADPVKKWTDLDYRLNEVNKELPKTIYYGDGFPGVFTNFGPGSIAACIGGSFIPAEDTVWFDHNPIITDWDNPPTVEFDPNSEMWRLTDTYTKMLCQNADGRYCTSIADLGFATDIIASLRGTQELLFDLYDNPEQVLALTEKLRPIWKRLYTLVADILFKYQDGMTSWLPIWCGERYYPLQCDFSAMMSPDMFGEFVMPELRDATEFLDRSVYHLDGPDAIVHLEHLLSLPRLSAIQWSPGAGNPEVFDEAWVPMYEKIQAAGKGLVLMGELTNIGEVEKILRKLSPKGLFVCGEVADEAHAKHLIDFSKKK